MAAQKAKCPHPEPASLAPHLAWTDGEIAGNGAAGKDRHRLLTVRFVDPAAGLGALHQATRSDATPGAAAGGPPCAVVRNRVLGHSSPAETWFAEGPVRRESHGPVEWAENGAVLFASLASRLQGNLAEETARHFEALLATVEEQGFPHLLRVWNFLPGINELENGTERYRLFNTGRAAAFDSRYGVAGAEARFSASSAVGSSGDRLVTCLAAAKSPGLHLGNPRQVHAFRYPTDYGPRPPSFTRATLAPPELGQVLFLSGTASIAGHETRHVGKLLLQLEETLHNIETLLAAAPGETAKFPDLPAFDLFRVYLREASDLELVREPLRRRIGPGPALHFVEADICRADLLLEIEGVAGLSR